MQYQQFIMIGRETIQSVLWTIAPALIASLFIGLLIGVILILGGLQFFPALALGPLVEHFQMLALTSH